MYQDNRDANRADSLLNELLVVPKTAAYKIPRQLHVTCHAQRMTTVVLDIGVQHLQLQLLGCL